MSKTSLFAAALLSFILPLGIASAQFLPACDPNDCKDDGFGTCVPLDSDTGMKDCGANGGLGCTKWETGNFCSNMEDPDCDMGSVAACSTAR